MPSYIRPCSAQSPCISAMTQRHSAMLGNAHSLLNSKYKKDGKIYRQTVLGVTTQLVAFIEPSGLVNRESVGFVISPLTTRFLVSRVSHGLAISWLLRTRSEFGGFYDSPPKRFRR